ncbi:peptidoglycan-binding protein, partial [Candidatus Peregrinibacteria bacterium]|nr:peptidoglycan-binding protein [Candidatus Peregrinibacteria bacterium]
KEHNFFPKEVKANGIYGPTTEQAVKDFQSIHNLPAVGYVGPLTRKALNKL